MNPVISVLLADDHAAIRQGLRMILSQDPGIEVVGEAGDGATAVAMSRSLRPEVVLMDIRMPGMDGIEATRQISAAGTARVLILTTFDLDDYVLGGLRAGAAGFLLKSASAEAIIQGIGNVAAGDAVLAPEVTRTVIEKLVSAAAAEPRPEARTPQGLAELTARELDVLRAVGAGWTNQQIARRLGIAETTVKTHLSRIFGKLNLVSRVQAALFCVEHGLG
ncbi:response regulator transcription factor [Arthrobacter russicus]|uniref:DNA-binding NarL/FixJ family response regulator n=1 Tax=Arthrobacter russicus TaxID=172040 RepID=A0ABU1J9N4_9MICC|nr:DNA-binding NarL/FixJ family response regulator [Arthrobacter russicus]